MNRDAILGLVAGFLTGLFGIPIAKNIELFDLIPYPFFVLLAALPLASLVGVATAKALGRWLPWVFQVAKFGLVGVLNTFIDAGILNILIFATGFSRGLSLSALNLVSVAAALLNSYWWNRNWVFQGGGGRETTQFLEFVAVSVLAAFISSGIVGGLTAYIIPPAGLSAEQWANAAKGVAIVFSFVWNFFGYKFIVFRKART